MIHNIRAWQPTASIETLKKRAQFLAAIRAFFADRDVMEVETPVMGQGTVTDPYIEAISVDANYGADSAGETQYLQTSPEYHMKRLLAAGSGAIYQMGKAFRSDDHGRHHNPEFTMLEWYRPGWSAQQLMREIEALITHLLNTEKAEILTYQEVMKKHLEY